MVYLHMSGNRGNRMITWQFNKATKQADICKDGEVIESVALGQAAQRITELRAQSFTGTAHTVSAYKRHQ